MEQNKLNLVDEKELENMSYEELIQKEKEVIYNPEATDRDLGAICGAVFDKEMELGIFKGYDIDEVFGELLKGTEFDNNKTNCKRRFATN